MSATTVEFKSQLVSIIVRTPFGWAAVAIVGIVSVCGTVALIAHEYWRTERARLGREQESGEQESGEQESEEQ